MDYLIDCTCGHDLTRHEETGCRGNGTPCPCRRSRLGALDSAIDDARANPWAAYLRSSGNEAAPPGSTAPLQGDQSASIGPVWQNWQSIDKTANDP